MRSLLIVGFISPILGFVAFFTAGLTAFYMFRIYLLTFEGNFRGHIFNNEDRSYSKISTWGKNGQSTKIEQEKNLFYPKESDNIILFALILLTIPTLSIGAIGESFLQEQFDSDFLSNWLHLSINSLENIHSENLLRSWKKPYHPLLWLSAEY